MNAKQHIENMTVVQKALLNKGKLLLLGDGSLVNNGATYNELSGKENPTFVYFITTGKLTKIGKSDNPENRLRIMQTGNGEKLELFTTIQCETQAQGFTMEKELHNKFKKYRKQGEWFELPENLIEILDTELSEVERIENGMN